MNIVGTTSGSNPTIAYCIIMMGQSNADGGAVSARMGAGGNNYAYKGILTGYPNARVAQENYSRTPAGVYIYNKQRTDDNLWGVDDGFWEPYEATDTGNAHNKGVANADPRIGCEGALAEAIVDYTGAEVFIIKPSWGATALYSGDTGASFPGPWNYQARQLATDAYIARAVRDFHIYRQNVKLRLVSVGWWQGERDASQGRSQAQYTADFADYYAYMDKSIKGNFLIESDKLPLWQLVKLKLNETAGETTINAAHQAFVAANPTFARYIDIDQGGRDFPRLTDMTVAEASPITKAIPNSLGIDDDNHSSHITQLAVGEMMFNNVQSAGLLIAA